MLCPDDGHQCPEAQEFVSSNGQKRYVERCDSCPLIKLDWSMQNTDAGRYFDRIFEIDSLLSLGFYVNPRTVSRSDLEALKTLHNERRSREAELAKPR